MIFENEKTPFKTMKRRISKSRKSHIFPQGLTHGFGSKMAIFSTFFLGNIGQENVLYDSLEKKKVFLAIKRTSWKKSKNWHFSKGVNPWFWSKNGNFSNFFFLGNVGQENVFYVSLETKNAFLGYKNNKFKKGEKLAFFQRG